MRVARMCVRLCVPADSQDAMEGWSVDDVGGAAGGAEEIMRRLGVRPTVNWEVNEEEGFLQFSGCVPGINHAASDVHTRVANGGAVRRSVVMRGIAQLSGPLALNKDTSLRDKEGLTMRVKGDGKRYSVLLQTPATESSPEHVRFIPSITGARALLCLRAG